MTFADRLAAVEERIAVAAARSGRDRGAVTVVATTKGHGVDADRAALAAGLIDLGESRVADLAEKAALLPDARWHLVGRLQTNKVRHLPATLHAIHSVDRPSLVEKLSGLEAELYIEVNVAGEPTKAGVAPADLPAFLGSVRERDLPVVGLMTVAPQVVDPEEVRPVFAALATLAERCRLAGLSMGMSDDYEVAIEEGATAVRLGRALFGPSIP